MYYERWVGPLNYESVTLVPILGFCRFTTGEGSTVFGLWQLFYFKEHVLVKHIDRFASYVQL